MIRTGIRSAMGERRSLLRLVAVVAASGVVGCSGSDGGQSVDAAGGPATDARVLADSGVAGADAALGDGGGSELPDGGAGSWDWTDQPTANDCDQLGCRQLTFTAGVRFMEWDVWGDLVVFNDGALTGSAVHVVDLTRDQRLTVPQPYGGTAAPKVYFPVVNGDRQVCYTNQADELNNRRDLYCADLDASTQQLLYRREGSGAVAPSAARYLDVYGQRVVSAGGCGDPVDGSPLCVFGLQQPDSFATVAPDRYGTGNSMWSDRVVWTTGLADNGDIRAFDFGSEQFVEVTDDAATQLTPRIHGDRVVYMDLAKSQSGPTGNWDHAAVFVYDLATQQRQELTSGEWIAAFPDVYGDLVVWADYRDSDDPNDINSVSGVEIWGYDLATSTEFQITNMPNRAKKMVRIWGDKVFVDMARTAGTSGNGLYMIELSADAR